MPTYRVMVTLHERRDYTVETSSKEKAKEMYPDFDYEKTVIEETVEEVEKLNG